MNDEERDSASLLEEYNQLVDTNRMSRGFMFYENFFDAVMEIEDERKKYLALKAIVEYGLYSKYPDNILDAEIQIMMKYISTSIDNTKINYMLRVVNSESYKKRKAKERLPHTTTEFSVNDSNLFG
jgi:hypothetical protein